MEKKKAGDNCSTNQASWAIDAEFDIGNINLECISENKRSELIKMKHQCYKGREKPYNIDKCEGNEVHQTITDTQMEKKELVSFINCQTGIFLFTLLTYLQWPEQWQVQISFWEIWDNRGHSFDIYESHYS